MEEKKLFAEIELHIATVIAQDTPLGKALWQTLTQAHPTDTAHFLGTLNRDQAQKLFNCLPQPLQLKTFRELTHSMQVFMLSCMNEQEQINALGELPLDELTDLFGHLSDEELKTYHNLLNKKARKKVLSLLKFDPQSAGGIMDSDVITLLSNFTVEKSISLLQRLSPNQDIHQQIYITDRDHQLLGHINLQDLVFHKPTKHIADFMHKNDLVVRAHEDQESVAKRMVYYDLMTVPVVDEKNHFLGVIPSDTLVDVIIEEAAEDTQKMAALPPMKYPYFEMSFIRLFYQRSYVLLALLIAESFSSPILRAYDAIITGILMAALPMLTSAGGNAGSQASAVVIQGLASGEFDTSNMYRLLKREILMSLTIALVLGVVSFGRIYFVGGNILECIAISGSLALIIFISTILGNTMPFLLHKFNIDPAFYAGPFLSTLMDILGILIFCYLSKALLG